LRLFGGNFDSPAKRSRTIAFICRAANFSAHSCGRKSALRDRKFLPSPGSDIYLDAAISALDNATLHGGGAPEQAKSPASATGLETIKRHTSAKEAIPIDPRYRR
jgi:hypothetical protein